MRCLIRVGYTCFRTREDICSPSSRRRRPTHDSTKISYFRYTHNQYIVRSKTRSRHIFSHVPLTNCLQSTSSVHCTVYGALVVTLAMLLLRINCRFIYYYYYSYSYFIFVSPLVVKIPRVKS